jgi:hypothetical protein
MRIEVRQKCLLIIPECDQDSAFIEDSLGVKTGEELKVTKVPDVKMGFVNNDSYVLKIEKK